MADMRDVKWWIPAVGLVTCATVVTAGFAWSIDRATQRYATAALAGAEVSGVSVDSHYRDVTLTGPGNLEDVAIAVVEEARLVKDVRYVVDPGTAPEPVPSATPSASPSPSATAEPTPEPSPTATAEPEPEPSPADALPAVLEDASGIRFAFDSANLPRSGKRTLDGLALAILATLAADPTIRIEVSGHSDSVGPAGYNQKLSQIRANVARDYLISRGVPANVLEAVGYGETQPALPNDTDSGRAANRRVEFSMVEDSS